MPNKKMMKHYFENFSFCPMCGEKYIPYNLNEKEATFVCDACRYNFQQHSALAIIVIVPKTANPYYVLFDTSGPNKRILLPGNFLFYGEDPESRIQKVLQGELGISLKTERFFNSERADYPYQKSLLSILTFFYLIEPIDSAPILGNMQDKTIITHNFLDIRDILSQKEGYAFSSNVDLLTIIKYHKYLKTQEEA